VVKHGASTPARTAAVAAMSSAAPVVAASELHRASLENVSRLARLVAHSINNVLAVSRGNLVLMRAGELDDDSRDMVDDVLHSLGMAEALSSSLAWIANHEPFALEVVDIAAFMDEHLQSLRDLVGREGGVELRLDRGLSPVLTDRRYLELAVNAIVRNAVDSMGAGATVRIRCAPVRKQLGGEAGGEQHRFVQISVSDDGPGFEGKARTNAFEAGFSTRGRGRAGIGLWLVRELARASGGDARLSAASKRGGATVVMWLPCVSQ
jgi:signal transduction histidine kinase